VSGVPTGEAAPVGSGACHMWPRVPLIDVVADAQAGFATGDRDPHGVLQLRMQNVDTIGLLDFSKPVRVPSKSASVEKYLLQQDDVVFNNTNSAELVGKSAFISAPPEPLVFSNHFTRLRTRRDMLDAKFLALWLLAQWQGGVFERLCDRWVGQAAVGRGRLLSLTMPLPPLHEQTRIATMLRKQLDAAARVRAAAERQAEAVEQLRLSVIDRAFVGLRSEWSMRPIGELARVVSGYAFKSAWFAGQGVRLLRNANVSQGSIDWTDTVRLPEELRPQFAEYELNAGDIVLALDRPIVAAGLKVARLVEADVPSLLLQRVATFRLGDSLDPGYLYAFLRTSVFMDAISGHEQSLGVPHVSPRQVAAVRLPVPTLAKQRDIVRALEGELSLASSVAGGLVQQAADIGRLPAALLRSAFSGDSPDN